MKQAALLILVLSLAALMAPVTAAPQSVPIVTYLGHEQTSGGLDIIWHQEVYASGGYYILFRAIGAPVCQHIQWNEAEPRWGSCDCEYTAYEDGSMDFVCHFLSAGPFRRYWEPKCTALLAWYDFKDELIYSLQVHNWPCYGVNLPLVVQGN